MEVSSHDYVHKVTGLRKKDSLFFFFLIISRLLSRLLLKPKCGVLDRVIFLGKEFTVPKKIATGTFTHNYKRMKTLKTFIKTHRKVKKL